MQISQKHKIVIAITGASGSIYAQVLLQKLQLLNEQIEVVGIVMSDNAKAVWQHELANNDFEKYAFKSFGKMDF